MTEQIAVPKTAVGEHGWRVTFAGMGINLALGILYTWSVISSGIPEAWGWSQADKSLPYSVCCLIFCLMMVPAGRLQDKFGPRVVAAIGGVLVGIGFILASMTTTPLGFVIGFGIIAGAGIGFGYASATPPAVKWFPAAKTGLIAGIGLCRTAGKIPDGKLWYTEDDAHLRYRFSGHNYRRKDHSDAIVVWPLTNASDPRP